MTDSVMRVKWGVVLDERGSTEIYDEATARAVAEADGGQLVSITTRRETQNNLN